jgi:hypothetical protein
MMKLEQFLVVLGHFGVDLLFMDLLLLLFVLELARLELMYPDMMGLKFKYPVGVGI